MNCTQFVVSVFASIFCRLCMTLYVLWHVWHKFRHKYRYIILVQYTGAVFWCHLVAPSVYCNTDTATNWKHFVDIGTKYCIDICPNDLRQYFAKMCCRCMSTIRYLLGVCNPLNYSHFVSEVWSFLCRLHSPILTHCMVCSPSFPFVLCSCNECVSLLYVVNKMSSQLCDGMIWMLWFLYKYFCAVPIKDVVCLQYDLHKIVML